MNDDLDDALRRRLSRLANAVPDRSTRRVQPVVRASGANARSWVGAGIAGVLAVMLLAVVGALYLGGAAAPSPSAASTPVASSSLAGVDSDGVFRLTFQADRATYRPQEPIVASATVEYIGPAAQIQVGTGPELVGFGVAEVGGTRRVDPVSLDSCESKDFTRGRAQTQAFSKSGGLIPGDPNTPFVRDYLHVVGGKVDPILRLPAGTWQLFAEFDLFEGTCGGVEHKLRATVTVEVR